MNVTPGLVSSPLVVQQSSLLYQPQPSIPGIFESQQAFAMQSQWNNNNNNNNNSSNNNNLYNSHQLPLQMSQYYNVFPEVPSTKTSWTFPNGCVTSNIVRFTGSPAPTYPVGSVFNFSPKQNTSFPTKRKSLVPENEEQPNKIFITEEKMAARMSGMHISNDFISHSRPTQNYTEARISEKDMDDELPDCASSKNSQPQLVICDELKNLSKDIDSIVPEPLIPIEKPTTALVLWRPPMSYLNVVRITPEEKYPQRSSVIITDITDRPDLDNNNINAVNLNTLSSGTVELPQEDVEIMET
ncbi:myb-like protein Z [Planococcus citri]|uniref:myb-like protein Z n=1 Tax=Planococcus citri TaxID=170843 RepID=UPI0031F84635